MRYLHLLAFFLTAHFCARAQQFRPKWVDHLGGGASGICQVFDITTDKQNNVYIAGDFSSDTIDFDPGPGVKYLKSDGNTDVFVGKYKPDGTLIWAESFSSVQPKIDESGSAVARAIVLDKDGNISIAGALNDTLDADPGPGVHYLMPSQGGGFIIHLDNNGNFLWAKAVGPGSIAGVEQLAADSQDNVVISTTFSKTTTVGDSTYTSPNGTDRGLVIKYSPAGGVLWSVCIQNNDAEINQRADGCTVDSKDNVIISGTFNYTVNFNPLGAAFNVTAPNRREAFIAKYSPSGIVNWVDTVNTNTEVIYNFYYPVIGIDRQDNIYFESSFRYYATFSNSVTLNAQGYEDLCFAKYSPSGVLQFAKSIGGPSIAQVYSFKIVSDKNNNIYLAGQFFNTVNFNPNPGNPQYLQIRDQGESAFIAEYDPNGNYIYAFKTGNPLCGATWAFGLAIDQNGNIDACGEFCSTANFDPTACSSLNLTALSTFYDGYFVQYAPLTLTNNVITAPPVASFCTAGTPGAITGSTPYGGIGDYAYQWQTSADSLNFVNITGADSINYAPPAITTTTYYRRMVSQTCARSITSNVVGLYIVSPPSAPQALGDTVCAGATTTLSIISPQQGLTYKWYTAATGDTSLSTGSAFTTPALNTTTVYYAEADNAACASPTRTAVTVTVLQPMAAPVVTVGPITATSITFNWIAVPGATAYQVNIDSGKTFSAPSSGGNGLTTTVPGLQPGDSVTVVVQAIGTIACQLSAGSAAVTASIPKNDIIYVPNAFTPNGDGKNDQVHVHSESIQTMTFYIYDQWGELLFTSTNIQNGWDGTYKGAKEPVGVYVYFVQATMIDGRKVTKKGTITLLR